MATKDTTQNDDPETEYKEYLENRKSFTTESLYQFYPNEEAHDLENFVQNFQELIDKFTEYEIAKVTKIKHEVDGCFGYRIAEVDTEGGTGELCIIISYHSFESLSEYKKRKEKEQTRQEHNKALNERLKNTKERNRQARILELRKELEKLEKEQK